MAGPGGPRIKLVRIEAALMDRTDRARLQRTATTDFVLGRREPLRKEA